MIISDTLKQAITQARPDIDSIEWCEVQPYAGWEITTGNKGLSVPVEARIDGQNMRGNLIVEYNGESLIDYNVGDWEESSLFRGRA